MYAEIWSTLQPIVILSPTTKQWQTIEKDFCPKWIYPNCIGALDGKHAVTQKPPNNKLILILNTKKEFSVVLMALIDANLRFITVDIGAYGKNTDGEIFKNWALGRALSVGTSNIPGSITLLGSNILMPYLIVGDEAFPLCTNLMHPYPRVKLRNNNIFKKLQLPTLQS